MPGARRPGTAHVYNRRRTPREQQSTHLRRPCCVCRSRPRSSRSLRSCPQTTGRTSAPTAVEDGSATSSSTRRRRCVACVAGPPQRANCGSRASPTCALTSAAHTSSPRTASRGSRSSTGQTTRSSTTGARRALQRTRSTRTTSTSRSACTRTATTRTTARSSSPRTKARRSPLFPYRSRSAATCLDVAPASASSSTRTTTTSCTWVRCLSN
jgi:hypothetical protein